MNDKNALQVIFGTGPVGMAIMDALTDKGYRNIRMINRSGKGMFPSHVELVTGDAMDKHFARKAGEGASVIYFALNPAYNKWLDLFPTLQENVLESAAGAGAKLIVMENVYMYGITNGKPMTEDTPYNAHTRKGKLRAEMHQQLMEAHQQGRVRVASARASDFVGPRVLESAMGERVIYNALAGKPASILGNADMPHTYTYMPDIGKGMVILAERDEALGQAWHIPADKTLTTRAFIEKIYAKIGNEPKIASAPKFILHILGIFNPVVREVIEMIYQFEEPFTLDHSKFVRAFGNIATPIDEVIDATVAWYKDHPKV